MELHIAEKESIRQELKDKESNYIGEIKRLKSLVTEGKEQALQNKVLREQLENELTSWQLKTAEALDNLERARVMENSARELADKQTEMYRETVVKLQSV